MLCGATQDGWVMVERSDRMWSTGEWNGKPLQYSCLENPMNSMKRQNDRILKGELPVLWGGASSLSGPQEAFLLMCSQKDLFDLENEKYVVSLSFV